jgi:Galactose oxidase, central domain
MPFGGLRGICASNALQFQTVRRIVPPVAVILLAHSACAQTWTELSPSGTPPVARGATTGVYDPTTDRMIVFGGRGKGGENRNDVWVLTHANGEGATGQWIRLIANGAAGSPPARSGHSAVYDSTNNYMIIFGGCSASCAPVLKDVWVLTNANGVGGTPAWTQLQLTGGPAPRTNAAVTYNASGNQLIVFGGQDGSANPAPLFPTPGFSNPPMDLPGRPPG